MFKMIILKMEKWINRLIAENQKSISNHTPCIVAADKQIGKLLNNNMIQ